MSLYRDRGVVLRTYKLGEADNIVVILTTEHGKVRAVAKGVRRTKSRFGARLEPLSNVSLLMYEGRGELDVVSQAETIDHFGGLRDDLDRLTKAQALLEFVDQIAQERTIDGRLYEMLVGALRSLTERNAALLVPAFFLRVLSHEGIRPEIDTCLGCGETADDVELVSFDLEDGGTRCRSCRRGIPVSQDALDLLRLVFDRGLTTALRADSSPAVHEVTLLATRWAEFHLERRLKALHVLEQG
jgi:DNA repair protein RecO (recombination protein O)